MTRLGCALAVALLLAVALAAPASSQHPGDADAGGHEGDPTPELHLVAIGFDSVRPARLDVLAGDIVRWTNGSARTHTVTADDDSFDSGRMGSSATYVRRFGAVGEAAYHCSLHPLIRGVVAVHDLMLEAPGQAAAPERPFPLSGRAALPPGTAVSIEADSGSGFVPVGSTEVDAYGRFGMRLAPTTTASYRAVAGGITSAAVRLLVLDRRVVLTVRRAMHGRVRLHAQVTPPSRGGRVVLQVYLPHRFGWWPMQQARLGKDSAATFTLHPKRRLLARVHYTLADGATTLAASRTVRVGPVRATPRRSGRPAPEASHHAQR
jgi:plastocyanin